MSIKDLKSLRTRLKQGEYNGVDIMHSWIAIDELIAAKLANDGEHSQDELIKGLKHNLSVIRNELIQIDEKQCSKAVWDRVSLALEFSDDH